MGEQRHGLNSSDVWVIFWEILDSLRRLGPSRQPGGMRAPRGMRGTHQSLSGRFRLCEDAAAARQSLANPLCRTDLGNLNLPVDMVAKLDALVRLCSCDCLLV